MNGANPLFATLTGDISQVTISGTSASVSLSLTGVTAGSYGSSTIMIKNISKFCSNCNEKVKMDADVYAADQMKRVIDSKAKADMKKDFETALAVH